MTAIYGPLIGTWDVEQAVIKTLDEWIDSYLTAVERDHEIRPRTLARPSQVDGIYGGIDFESWEEDLLPALIVVVNLAPNGDELLASAGYGQWYEVQIGAVVIGDDEHQARELGSHYIAAAAGVLVQQGSLGGFAGRTELVVAPHVEFPNLEERRLANGVCAVNVFVEPIVDEKLGPVSPDPLTNPPPDPGNRPQVEHVGVTVIGEALD
jgi:hypothetical protein